MGRPKKVKVEELEPKEEDVILPKEEEEERDPNALPKAGEANSPEVLLSSHPNLYRVDCPPLEGWTETKEERYYTYQPEELGDAKSPDTIRACYEEWLGLQESSILSTYVIVKNHYRDRITDICRHLNYFLTFYDEEKELFVSMLSIKFAIDQNPALSQKTFHRMMMDLIVTPSFVHKVKLMAYNLYHVNINTDVEGKFKSTPKITNDQARQLLALSFCYRLILPVCIHYSNTNVTFVGKKEYLKVFDKLFMAILEEFEKDDVPVYHSVYRFVEYRVERQANADSPIWEKKEQLYGITTSIYIEEMVHEVIFVKSLYKLTYSHSVVSFLDGIVFRFHINFKREKFKCKPVEIDPEDQGSDNDESLSHAEALEMSVYRIDESNAMVDDANSKQVLLDLQKRYNIHIPEEELEFYRENCKINDMSKFLLHSFYSSKFHNGYAIDGLDRHSAIYLLVLMKKFLLLKGMTILPQICTAVVHGKFKDNSIKNAKFIEKLETSDVWNDIIDRKFRYVRELNQKEDMIVKKLSTIINSSFSFVDFHPEVNGKEYEDVDLDQIISEFTLFLSII